MYQRTVKVDDQATSESKDKQQATNNNNKETKTHSYTNENETTNSEVKNGIHNENTGTTEKDVEAGQSESKDEVLEKNGNSKLLQRKETIPDIKRDTSGQNTQYIATGIVNLGAFAAGVCVAWSSSTLPRMTGSQSSHFETSDVAVVGSRHTKTMITEYQASWVASLLCLGAVFGAVPSGLISEAFGRKKTLLYLALPLIVSWILVASSPNVYGSYVGRFIGGVAVGAFSVSIPPYVEDIAEKHLLPTLANFYHVHFTCGILFGYIIGLIHNSTWFYFLCCSIPIAFFIAFIFLPESPAYLVSQGKSFEAKAAMRYFRGIDNNIDTEMATLKQHMREQAKKKVTFKELFSTRATAKALVVSFGLMIFQQLSGIYPVLFYAEKIVMTFPLALNASSASIILGFCLVSSTYFSTKLLKKVRRRVLLITSLLVMSLSLGIMATYYHLTTSKETVNANYTWIPICMLCIFVSFYAAGIGPIPWLMLREIFPPNVTRRATAITAGFHWFLAFGVTKLYQNLVDKIKPGWTLWNFAIVCVIGVIFVYFFVPESKGKTLEEIQDEFDGIHKNKKHTHVIEVECISYS